MARMANAARETRLVCQIQVIVPTDPGSSIRAEGMGLEPICPFGQRFSSVCPDVLSRPSCPYLRLSLLVSTLFTS